MNLPLDPNRGSYTVQPVQKTNLFQTMNEG
jgi:hypothetical protein